MDASTLGYYATHADKVAALYESAQCAVARYFAVAFPAGSRVLEAGAGLGRALTALLSAGYDGYGIDPSDPLRQAAVDHQHALADRLTG